MVQSARSGDADLHAMVETFFRETFTTDNALITEAIKRMLAAGGKRLRPRITLLAVDACGGKAVEQLHLAAFMELIHVATLIHDDVVDNASTRRGVNATAVDYGNRVSVLAGDYLFAWIFKNVTAGYPHPVPHILSATLADICDGEVLQLRALGELTLPLNDYIEVARKKTASLFAASAQCGAIMGGGDAEEVAALLAYGDAFGIAFQMKDDLLDVTADERSLGKPVGNDLTERKMTIPIIEALALGDDAFRAEVRAFYSGKENGGLHAIVEGIARQGGLAGTRRQIAGFVGRAKAALEPIRPGAAKNELEKLADALLVE
jgi:octaprenyl-diphosphate synthase